MKDTWLAVQTSYELDDERRAGAQTPSTQRSVHEALVRAGGAGMEASPVGMRERILGAVEASEPESLPMRRGPVFARWAPLALAAAVVLAVGAVIVTLAVRDSAAPGGVLPPESITKLPASRIFAQVTELDAAELMANPRRPEAAMSATVEAPMLAEARAMRADARAALESVLAPLPVEVSGLAFRQ